MYRNLCTARLFSAHPRLGCEPIPRRLPLVGITACMLLLSIAVVPRYADANQTGTGTAISEFQLSAESLFPGSITEGPDRNLWFLLTKGQPGRTIGEMELNAVLSRITPSGEISEFPLPEPSNPYGEVPFSIIGGPQDKVWYLRRDRLGSVTTSGQVSESEISGPDTGGQMTIGPGNNIWFTRSISVSPINTFPRSNAIVRVTPTGEQTAFPLPSDADLGLAGIATAQDGAVWFAETFARRIGRVAPDGQVSEYPVPFAPTGGIAQTADGTLWFASNEGLHRIDPAGVSTELLRAKVFNSELVTGGDGGLWFIKEPGVLGHLTPGGRVVAVDLPGDRNAGNLAAGPEGTIWYTAEGRGPCEGGGGTCMAIRYDRPGIVGRIAPDKLPFEILGTARTVSRRWGRIRLRCAAGGADGLCHGRMTLASGGRRMGGRRFVATPGETRVVAVRLGARVRSQLLLRRRAAARVKVKTEGGESVDRRLVLRWVGKR
jgi:virginiamycin B lyase